MKSQVPCGIQVVVSSAVGYQGLRFRRVTGWRLREDPLVMGKGRWGVMVNPLVPLGFVSSSSCLLDFDLMRSRLSSLELDIYLFNLLIITEL